MLCQHFFQKLDLSGWILRKFNLDKCDNNDSRGFVLEVGLEYPK